MFDGNGNAVTLYTSKTEADVIAYSVGWYINSQLGTDDTKLKEVLLAMVTYGTYAQRYFRDVKKNELVDAVDLCTILDDRGMSMLDVSGITLSSLLHAIFAPEPSDLRRL